jgi:hypothetical protein
MSLLAAHGVERPSPLNTVKGDVKQCFVAELDRGLLVKVGMSMTHKVE